MKRMLRTVAVLIAIGLSSQHAQAGAFLSGNMLYDYINSDNVMLRREALGYVGGVADVEGAMTKPRICMTHGVTLSQILDVANQYLAAHPELRHYNASYLVITSFITAFPCTK